MKEANLGIYSFFSDIGNFFRGGSVLGIDIGTTAIKGLELKKIGDVLVLKNYGLLETKDYLDHPNQALQTSSLPLSGRDAGIALRLLIKEMRPKSNIAIATLPLFATFSTTLDFPALSDVETEKAIGYQAAQYIPLPITEVSLEWRRVGEYVDKDGAKHQQVLLVAVPKDIIKNYTTAFKMAGIKLLSLECEAFALMRGLRGSLTDAPTLIVDLGSISTGILIGTVGYVQYLGETDYGGISLTQALSRSLEISMFRAEELKRRRGLLGSGAESELSTILLPFLDVIINESRRVKDLYERQFGKRIEKLVLTGGGANLLGIEKYFSSQMNLVLGHHSFTSGIQLDSSLIPTQKDLDNRFATAYGAARHYFAS